MHVAHRLNWSRCDLTAFIAKSRAFRRSLMGVSAALCSSVIDWSTCTPCPATQCSDLSLHMPACLQSVLPSSWIIVQVYHLSCPMTRTLTNEPPVTRLNG